MNPANALGRHLRRPGNAIPVDSISQASLSGSDNVRSSTRGLCFLTQASTLGKEVTVIRMRILKRRKTACRKSFRSPLSMEKTVIILLSFLFKDTLTDHLLNNFFKISAAKVLFHIILLHDKRD